LTGNYTLKKNVFKQSIVYVFAFFQQNENIIFTAHNHKLKKK